MAKKQVKVKKQSVRQSRSTAPRTKRKLLALKLVLLIVAFLAAAYGCVTGLHYLLDQKQQAEIASDKQAQDERNEQLGITTEQVSEQARSDYRVDAPDKPRLLTIAKAGVTNARVQGIGLMSPAADGSQQMDAPKNVHDAGWYNCQINPIAKNRCANYISPAGNNNTETAAVVDGHSCGSDGCIFDKLGDLTTGDEIVIELGSGAKLTYIVDKVEVVDLADLDMTRVMTSYQQGRPGLNLITCDGSWSSRDSRGVRTMNKRIVVYSTLKEN